ncbi:MAG: exosortase/archaeosortase family protein, partial [Dehalococcoidia bacterium]
PADPANAPRTARADLLLPVAALIIWTRRHDLDEKEPVNWCIFLLVIGLGMHIAGFILMRNLISGLSLFLTLPGLILLFRGEKALRALAFPIFMLIFMIPFPWVIEEVGVWMQSFAARSSAWFVDLLGVEVTRTGSEIKLADAAFKVDMACSGMHSLIALLALSAIFAYVLKGTFTKKAILFLLSIPVAILANLIRLVSILLIGERWGEDVATGFYHDAASPFLFLVAIIFMVLIAKLLGFNLREIPD